jgi:hypothetical protein
MGEIYSPRRPEIESLPEQEPSLRGVLEKALEAGYITEDDLDSLGESMQDILASLYDKILKVGDDPNEVLSKWGIVAPMDKTE